MLVIESRAGAGARPTEQLVLSFERRSKSRLRTQLASGEEVGLSLERGVILRGGDLLLGSDGRVVQVVAAPEQLAEAHCTTAALLARAAYHLGNRHVAVQLGDGWLRIQADILLQEMLTGLGIPVSEVVAPFEPEAGAYAHEPPPGAGDPPAKARIHRYRSL